MTSSRRQVLSSSICALGQRKKASSRAQERSVQHIWTAPLIIGFVRSVQGRRMPSGCSVVCCLSILLGCYWCACTCDEEANVSADTVEGGSVTLSRCVCELLRSCVRVIDTHIDAEPHGRDVGRHDGGMLLEQFALASICIIIHHGYSSRAGVIQTCISWRESVHLRRLGGPRVFVNVHFYTLVCFSRHSRHKHFLPAPSNRLNVVACASMCCTVPHNVVLQR